MKIVVINGSPKGKASATNVMSKSFLKGAKEAGAETVNIFLSEKRIEHCKGCFSCWFNNPGKCIIDDDMKEVLKLAKGGDVFVLATPLYFDNISGMLKVFMDRMIVLGDPHMEKDQNGETRHIDSSKNSVPKLVLMSNCGFPEREHFQVISHWIKRAAHHMHTEVIGEIYASQGPLLTTSEKGLQPIISAYKKNLEKAGKEIVKNLKLSESTRAAINKNFIPNEIYLKETNRSFDSILSK
ncbi:MAG: flavodoxin family protein [Firmicutes bacterium]|nr:flavodoxin family protein [Bacillota bacterium]